MNCPECPHRYESKGCVFCSLETNHNMGLLWEKEYKRTPKWCYFKNSKHSTTAHLLSPYYETLPEASTGLCEGF